MSEKVYISRFMYPHLTSIYLSGLITGTDDYENRFFQVECWLEESFKIAAWRIKNPVEFCRDLPLCWETRMEKCFDVLLSMYENKGDKTLYLLRLPGWEKSKGARQENAIAKMLGFTLCDWNSDARTIEIQTEN